MRVIGAGAGLQVITYLLGIYDEVYQIIIKHNDLVVIGIVAYGCLYWFTYDAELTVQKRKYSERLKGASVRLPRQRRDK